MSTDTEVISCPACRHLLRVPAADLGQTVACPECQAVFRAPVREGGRLTEAVLVTAPPTVAAPRPARADWLLSFPGFGLMLVGVASFIANGYLFGVFLFSADGGKEWMKNQLPGIRKMGIAAEGPQAPPEAQDEQVAADLAPRLKYAWPAGMAAAGLTFAGGLAIVFRRWYRLAQLGCVVAALNLPNGCCVPGALFGVWGLLLLMGDEAREHFGLAADS